jgi:hypothetical protein
MAQPITPISGYAFKHRDTGELSLMLFLGTGDSIYNYEEISREEYERILRNQEIANAEESGNI